MTPWRNYASRTSSKLLVLADIVKFGAQLKIPSKTNNGRVKNSQ